MAPQGDTLLPLRGPDTLVADMLDERRLIQQADHELNIIGAEIAEEQPICFQDLHFAFLLTTPVEDSQCTC